MTRREKRSGAFAQAVLLPRMPGYHAGKPIESVVYCLNIHSLAEHNFLILLGSRVYRARSRASVLHVVWAFDFPNSPLYLLTQRRSHCHTNQV